MRRLLLNLLTALAVTLTLVSPAHADPVPPEVTETRISLASSTKGPVPAGTTVTFTGKLEGLTADGWIPLGGQIVSVVTYARNRPLATTTTGADGTYSATAKLDGEVVLRAAFGSTYSPTLTIMVQQKIKLNLGLSMDVWGNIKATGSTDYVGSAQPTSIDLEYSATGRSGWKRVRTASSKYGLSEFFSIKTFYYGRSGYWRLHYKGGKGILDSTSKTVYVWRTNTHFTDVKVAPKKLRYKAKTTFSGRLWTYSAKGKRYGFAKKHVQLLFSCKKDKKWYNDFGWTWTDAKGRFKKKVRTWCTGTVAAVYWGEKGRFAAESNHPKLTVTGSPYRLRDVTPLTPFTGVFPHKG